MALRLALFAVGPARTPERALQPDSARYRVLAHNLYEYGTFGKAEEDGLVHREVARLRTENGTLPPADVHGLRPESFRTPGYPCFLAALEACGGGIRTALLVQCLLGALLTGVVVAVAEAAGLSRGSALLAGLVWALHPALITADNLLLSESLFNVCCLGGLFAAVRVRPPWGWLLAGLLLGGGTLVRPLGLLFLPAACALTWKQTAAPWRTAFILGLFAVLPPALWAVRNRAVGEGLRVSSVGDINLLYYSDAYARSEEHGQDWLKDWPQQVAQLSQQLERSLQPGEDVIAATRRLAFEEFQARPGAVLRVHAKSAFKMLFSHSLGTMMELLGVAYQPSGLLSRLVLREETAASSSSGLLLAAALAWMMLNGIVVFSATVGFVRALWRRCWCVLVVGGLTTLLFMAATGAVGTERMRLPILLPLLVLAGYAWQSLPRLGPRRSYSRDAL